MMLARVDPDCRLLLLKLDYWPQHLHLPTADQSPHLWELVGQEEGPWNTRLQHISITGIHHRLESCEHFSMHFLANYPKLLSCQIFLVEFVKVVIKLTQINNPTNSDKKLHQKTLSSACFCLREKKKGVSAFSKKNMKCFRFNAPEKTEGKQKKRWRSKGARKSRDFLF